MLTTSCVLTLKLLRALANEKQTQQNVPEFTVSLTHYYVFNVKKLTQQKYEKSDPAISRE